MNIEWISEYLSIIWRDYLGSMNLGIYNITYRVLYKLLQKDQSSGLPNRSTTDFLNSLGENIFSFSP